MLVTRLDVQDRESIDAAVAQTIARFGQIDVLINNAGFSLFGVFEGISREKVLQQFDVNVFGLMDVTRAVLPHMRQRRAGIVLNVSSGAGVFGLPMISLYNATKFALEGWSESLSYELKSQGITVKIVEPGGVITTAFGQRMGQEALESTVPPGYEHFVAHTNEAFNRMRASRLATAQDVAKVICDAASDGREQLRYVATDDIRPWIQARREAGEDTYMAMMREHFATGRS